MFVLISPLRFYGLSHPCSIFFFKTVSLDIEILVQKIYIMTKIIKITPYLCGFNWMLNSWELIVVFLGVQTIYYRG